MSGRLVVLVGACLDVETPALVIQIVGEILGARLTGVTNIRAVFDFK